MLVYLHDIKQSYERSVAIASQLASSNAHLALRIDEARLDALTKLPRRDLFTENAELLRASSVTNGMGFATLFIDLDGFKSINDRFGHDHGDIVLVRTAEALKSVLRDTDVAGRLGGDEFGILMMGDEVVTIGVPCCCSLQRRSQWNFRLRLLKVWGRSILFLVPANHIHPNHLCCIVFVRLINRVCQAYPPKCRSNSFYFVREQDI